MVSSERSRGLYSRCFLNWCVLGFVMEEDLALVGEDEDGGRVGERAGVEKELELELELEVAFSNAIFRRVAATPRYFFLLVGGFVVAVVVAVAVAVAVADADGAVGSRVGDFLGEEPPPPPPLFVVNRFFLYSFMRDLFSKEGEEPEEGEEEKESDNES